MQESVVKRSLIEDDKNDRETDKESRQAESNMSEEDNTITINIPIKEICTTEEPMDHDIDSNKKSKINKQDHLDQNIKGSQYSNPDTTNQVNLDLFLAAYPSNYQIYMFFLFRYDKTIYK